MGGVCGAWGANYYEFSLVHDSVHLSPSLTTHPQTPSPTHTGERMDATTGTIYSNLSTDAWRRMVAALVAAIAIQACYRSGLTTRGTTPQRWGPIAVAEFKAREACPEIFPQPVDYTPWEASPKHMAEQIKKWYVRYVHTGGTEPKPRPGRPRTVSDPILKTLVDHVKSVHYDSAAKYEHDAPFQDVLKSHKITFKSLWRSMQHYDPTLQKNLKVEHRPFLSPEQWGDRLDRSAAWLRKLVNPNAPGVKMVSAVEAEREYGVSDGAFPLPPDIGTAEFESDAWLNLTIFNGFAMTDEKTFICNPTDYTAWTAGPRGQSITIEDYRCGSSRPNTIKYIITVCPAFGVVRWEPVAGTTGRAYTPPPELQYQVRWELMTV